MDYVETWYNDLYQKFYEGTITFEEFMDGVYEIKIYAEQQFNKFNQQLFELERFNNLSEEQDILRTNLHSLTTYWACKAGAISEYYDSLWEEGFIPDWIDDELKGLRYEL